MNKPISRAEAIAIAKKILEDAERERAEEIEKEARSLANLEEEEGEPK